MRLLACVVLLCGCSTAHIIDLDASPDGATPGDPLAPMIPWLTEDPNAAPVLPMPGPPLFEPCPSGWTLAPPDSMDDAAFCEPWPSGVQPDCADGTMLAPGDTSCTLVGSACAGDGWPTGLPVDAIYVDAAAAGTELGTRAEPYDTIAEAMAVASSGDTIALHAGTYDEVVQLGAGVTLRGACASGTTITSSSFLQDESGGVVEVRAPSTVLRDVRVTGRRMGVWVNGGQVELRDVVIDNTVFGGMVVQSGRISGTRVLVTSIDPRTDGWAGYAALVHGGGVLDVSHIVIDAPSDAGIFCDANAQLTLRDAAILHTAPRGAGDTGDAIMSFGCTITLERAVIEDAGQIAAYIANSNTSLTHVVVRRTQTTAFNRHGIAILGGTAALRHVFVERTMGSGLSVNNADVMVDDLFVRDIQPSDSNQAGVGVWAEGGGRVHGQHVLVSRVQGTGLFATGASSSIDLDHVRVVDVRAQPNEGIGARAIGGGSLFLDTASIERTRGAALRLDTGASATISHLFVHEILPRTNDSGGGFALDVIGGASALVTTAILERARQNGIHVSGALSRLTLEDVALRDVMPSGDGSGGEGIDVGMGGALTANRLAIATTIFAAVRGPATLTDLAVRDVMPGPDQSGGYALLLDRPGTLDVTRAALSRSAAAAVWGQGPDAVIHLEHVRASDCLGEPSSMRRGNGLVAREGATIDGTRIAIERCRDVGIQAIGEGAQITLTDTRVTDTSAPLCGDCPGAAVGVGLGVYDGAHATLTRFLIARSAGCGVQLARNGEIDLVGGDVAMQPVGVNVQSAGFDTSRVTDRVVFIDNGTELDTSAMRLPEL